MRIDGRPQVVAHRGASSTNAEHTLAAYVAALDEGAEALECDVRLTADGHLVCVHDRDTVRTGQTRGVISTMELSDLERIDFARWKHPWADLDDEAPDTDSELHTVLTLRRLLETARDYHRPIELAIETKHPTRYAGLVERRLVEMLRDFGWSDSDAPVRVMSFSWVALRRVRRLAPELPVVQLVHNQAEWLRARPFIESDWIAGPGIKNLRENPDLIRRMRDSGRRVHVWTVNRQKDIDLCVQHGVEAVITDKPGATLAYLDR